jgi:hypothetical protein
MSRQYLDRNEPNEPRVARFVDFTHATCPDGGNDLIGSKAGPGYEWHGLGVGITYLRWGPTPSANRR